MGEVEAAKRQLVEYQKLTEQKLQEEREKTIRAVVSLSVSRSKVSIRVTCGYFVRCRVSTCMGDRLCVGG